MLPRLLRWADAGCLARLTKLASRLPATGCLLLQVCDPGIDANVLGGDDALSWVVRVPAYRPSQTDIGWLASLLCA